MRALSAINTPIPVKEADEERIDDQGDAAESGHGEEAEEEEGALRIDTGG